MLCPHPINLPSVSSSSSSSDTDSVLPASPNATATAPQDQISQTADSHAEDDSEAEPVFTKKRVNPEQSFEDFYLRQATKEFANDLDKLRSASDFNARSVPLLVQALKQGTACFGREERVRVGNAAEGET